MAEKRAQFAPRFGRSARIATRVGGIDWRTSSVVGGLLRRAVARLTPSDAGERNVNTPCDAITVAFTSWSPRRFRSDRSGAGASSPGRERPGRRTHNRHAEHSNRFEQLGLAALA